MTQEEITNIIQNLNEEELESVLHNAKQQVEVINESLKTTESRTKLLIAFLVAAIAFCIPVVVSCENPTYFRLFCGLVIASYITEVLIIVHCYFCEEFPSQVAKTESLLEFARYYKQINNEKPLLSTKQDVLEEVLNTTIPKLEQHARKRANIFNCCLVTTIYFPLLFGVILLIAFCICITGLFV